MRQFGQLSSLCLLILLLPQIHATTIVPRTVALSSVASSASFTPTSTASSVTATTLSSSTITPAPSIEDLELGLQQKWHVTTYWSCVTLGTHTHCGWHEPVLPGGTEIAGAPGRLGVDGKMMVGMGVGGLVVGALLR